MMRCQYKGIINHQEAVVSTVSVSEILKKKGVERFWVMHFRTWSSVLIWQKCSQAEMKSLNVFYLIHFQRVALVSAHMSNSTTNFLSWWNVILSESALLKQQPGQLPLNPQRRPLFGQHIWMSGWALAPLYLKHVGGDSHTGDPIFISDKEWASQRRPKQVVR